jgi:acyl carrier protein
MLEARQVAFQIAAYLNQALCLSGSLKPDTDMLDEGLVDSLMIMDLVEHLRLTYGVHLSGGDLKPQHFRSANTMSDLVVARFKAAEHISML